MTFAVFVFLILAFVGAFVQTVAGFALGMILVALAAGFELVSLPVLTATVSLLSLANVSLALRTQLDQINWKVWRLVSLGQVPAIGAGLYLMVQLHSSALALLQLLLGLFVLFGSLSMMRPNALLDRPSSKHAQFVAGVAGGLCGGLFSASGPVMGWFFYRQPWPLAPIRATLLACFGMTTAARTLLVIGRGEMQLETLTLTIASLPVIFLGTWLGGRWADRVSVEWLRRWVFRLLVVMGCVIIGRAVSLLAGF